MVDYPFPSDILASVIENLDITATISINNRKAYQWRNCVRPSSLKYATVKGQLYKLFDPDLLYAANLIDYDEAQALKNANFMDLGGFINCNVGTLYHAFLLPAFEKALLENGISAKQEHPLISKKYCIRGQADLVIFDHEEKYINLVDLKTTGPAILDRDECVGNDYMRQLLAYGLCLEELYPDYRLESCCIVSLCKIPNSTIIVPVDKQEKWMRGEVRELQVMKVGAPCLAQWEIDFADLKTFVTNKKKPKETFLKFFEDLAILVIETNKTIAKSVKGYSHWTIDEKLYQKELEIMETEYGPS